MQVQLRNHRVGRRYRGLFQNIKVADAVPVLQRSGNLGILQQSESLCGHDGWEPDPFATTALFNSLPNSSDTNLDAAIKIRSEDMECGTGNNRMCYATERNDNYRVLSYFSSTNQIQTVHQRIFSSSNSKCKLLGKWWTMFQNAAIPINAEDLECGTGNNRMCYAEQNIENYRMVSFVSKRSEFLTFF